jgi:hypothetical protein
VEQKAANGFFATLSMLGARINDLQRKSLICKESENDTFRFPWSKKPRMDFLRPYPDEDEVIMSDSYG